MNGQPLMATLAGSGSVTTTIAVTNVSPDSEAYGQNAQVTITAVLSWAGSGPAPTASAVTISGNAPSTYGTTSCGAPSGNTMTCTNTYTPTVLDVPGYYTMSAAFAGEGIYSGSSSPQTNNFSITQATAATVVTSSLNPSVFGQSVTFTATISGEYGLVKGRSTSLLKGGVQQQNATGTVTWSTNTGCGTTTVTSGNPGVATCTTSILAVGSDTITATYSGDNNHSGSTGTLSGGQTVNPAASTTTVASSLNPSIYGQAVTFTANVAAVSPGVGTPTGTVQFTIDGSNFGSPVTLASGSATSGSTSTLTEGTHTVTAVYLGSTNFAPSTSPVLNQVVQGAIAQISPSSLNFGNQTVGVISASQSVTLTNIGNATLTITSIVVSVSNGTYAKTNTCGTSLAAGASCKFTLSWTPSIAGNMTGSITFTDNAPGSPQTVSLSGVGVVPTVTLSPTSLTFPTQVVQIGRAHV